MLLHLWYHLLFEGVTWITIHIQFIMHVYISSINDIINDNIDRPVNYLIMPWRVSDHVPTTDYYHRFTACQFKFKYRPTPNSELRLRLSGAHVPILRLITLYDIANNPLTFSPTAFAYLNLFRIQIPHFDWCSIFNQILWITKVLRMSVDSICDHLYISLNPRHTLLGIYQSILFSNIFCSLFCHTYSLYFIVRYIVCYISTPID